MTKCGKGCMPECEYFTTGGCISPFNCPYKIEAGYINSATSIPTYMEQYNGMSDDDVKRLKAENADLHEKLKETEHRADVAERALLNLAYKIVIYIGTYTSDFSSIDVGNAKNYIELEIAAENVKNVELKQVEKELAEEEKK